MRSQDVAAGHVQDVRGGELKVHRGAVGVVDDGRQESILSWTDRAKNIDKNSRIYSPTRLPMSVGELGGPRLSSEQQLTSGGTVGTLACGSNKTLQISCQ